MFGKKKEPSVDIEFESVNGETILSFCQGNSLWETLLRNGMLNDNDSQINDVLKKLGKNDPKTRHNINEVIHRLSKKA